VDDIIAFAFDGIGYHAKTIGNTKYPDFVDKWSDEEYYEYDEEKAQALFEEAGVPAGKTYPMGFGTSAVGQEYHMMPMMSLMSSI
jgi:ABC-type transport system substrate-binding protein